ncbi:MAG: cytochrome c3 family protein [Bacteroidales bacterium]|nr:cytochrome c3 family protein [Bacteroidales bacterium]
MKTLIKLFAVVTLAFTVQLSMGQISGTKHDFSTKGWNPSGEICIVCHTPHNAITGAEPLWNHELSTATYTVYSSSTMDATPGQPNGNSKLCLSCHDGTVAIDNFGGATGGSQFIGGNKNLGTDLSNDHPISFTYDAALAGTDGGLFDPTTTNSGLGGTITADMLFANEMQCASCHDVHDDTNGDFLVMSNAASALCLTCHNK